MFWWEDNQNKFNPKLVFNDIVGLNGKSSERGSHPCSNAVCDPRSNLCAYSVRRPSGGITSGLRATELPLARLSLSCNRIRVLLKCVNQGCGVPRIFHENTIIVLVWILALNIWWFLALVGAHQFTIITLLQHFPWFWPPQDWFIPLSA